MIPLKISKNNKKVDRQMYSVMNPRFKPELMFKEFKNNHKDFKPLLVQTDELVYTENPHWTSVEDAKILVVGGGPSSNRLEPEDFARYDQVWSMNHFFMGVVLRDVKVDVCMLCAEVKFDNKDLKEYLKRFQPLVGFECPTGKTNRHKSIQKFYTGYGIGRSFLMHTRFYSKLGYAPRMMIFAAFLGASQIDFIGLDGPRAILRGKHAFQPGKRQFPSGITKGNCREIFAEQYSKYYDYMEKTFPDTKLVSLDKENDLHERAF